MPTHIFVRLGEWADAIELNRRAAAAALEHPAGEHGEWIWDEFPHATEYLVYAYLQQANDSAALEAMTRLQTTPNLQPSFKTAFHLSSIPARYALERKAWSEATNLAVRADIGINWDQFPWPEAVTWFARGLGAIHGGDLPGALAAEARLNALRSAALTVGEELFARNIEVLRLQLAAWLAASDGRDAEAIELMRAAVLLETETPKHAVTPAPTLPASELFADLLMQLNHPVEALESYRTSLRSTPGRFNSILGAARAAHAAGDTAAAASYYRQLLEQSFSASARGELLEARAQLTHTGGSN
jgi:tetratricopeptide (TPR) repeat protein